MTQKNIVFGLMRDLSINLGDQALALGCFEKIKQNKIEFLNIKTDKISFINQKNVKITHLPGKGKIKNLLFLCKFSCKLFFQRKKIKNIYCIGADMLDGNWGEIDKLFRGIFIVSKIFQIPLKIISCSFNKKNVGESNPVLRFVENHATFFVRDSMSMAEIKKEIKMQKKLTLSSDISFLAGRARHIPKDINNWLEKQKNSHKKVLMLCIANRPSIKDMNLFINKITKEVNSWENWSVCVVKHIFDTETERVSRQLFNSINVDKFYLDIQDVLIVRKITEKADMAISLLMHFALGSIASNTPVVVLDYFKKIKGLFGDLNLEEYVCEYENELIPLALRVRDKIKKVKEDIKKAKNVGQKKAKITFKKI